MKKYLDMIVVGMLTGGKNGFTTISGEVSTWYRFNRGRLVSCAHVELANAYGLRMAFLDQTGF